MKNYKKWTGEQRQKSLNLTNKAKKLGLIGNPTKCRCCGQDKGIIQLHNKDYDVTLNYVPKLIDGTATEFEKSEIDRVLVPLCWRCHMIYHSKYRNRAAYDKYFAEVKSGKVYPPVYRHDFNILKNEHGIL